MIKKFLAIFAFIFSFLVNSIRALISETNVLRSSLDKIDILFLHNFFIEYGDNNSNYKNKINNKYFING